MEPDDDLTPPIRARPYIEADEVDQGVEDLSVAWTSERRQEWVIDQHQTVPPPSRSPRDGFGVGL